MPQTWNDCLDQLRTRVSVTDINTWIAPLHPVHRDNTLKLLAPNRYVLDYVKKNLFGLIEEIILAKNNGVERVQVEIGGHGSSGQATGGAGNAASTGSGNTVANSILNSSLNSISPPNSPPNIGSVMHRDFTFANHVEGNSNQVARAAALQVGENPGLSCNNPLFIYGDVGLGKTHLMQAAGHLMLQKNPRAKVVYVRSELFVNNMVAALRNNAMEEFKRHYRSVNALLIDDIQFFARKTGSQEEFFHTFNTVLEGRRQIIITSDRIPSAITDVDDRLISRFDGGLSVGIDPPELETRVAILERKAQEQNIVLPHEVAFFVAHAVHSNVRALAGALHSIIARAGFTGRPIDVDLAREALHDQLAHQQTKTSIESIQRTVAEYYKLRVHDLLSPTRQRKIARPRQLAMLFAKEYTPLSLTEIGERFGGRDHTTVLYACRQIEKLVQRDERIKEDHRNLQRLFGA